MVWAGLLESLILSALLGLWICGVAVFLFYVVSGLFGLLVESYGTWLLLQRLVDASKDSDIPTNVPFTFVINNRKPNGTQEKLFAVKRCSSLQTLVNRVKFLVQGLISLQPGQPLRFHTE